MPLRVLHIASDLELSDGWKQMSLVLEAMPGDTVRSHVFRLAGHSRQEAVFPFSARPLAGDAVSSFRVRESGILDAICTARIMRMARAWRPDVVHVWKCGRPAHVRVGIWGTGRIPLVVSEFSHEPVRWDWPCGLMRRPYRSVAPPYLPSRADPARACVVPMSVAQREPIATSDWKSFLAAIQVPEQALVIGAIANEGSDETLKHLIWSTELLRVVHADAHFVLFRQRHSNHLERFRDQIELSERVHCVGLPADSAAVLPHLDLFWSPNTDDGQASLLWEAVAAGVPTLAVDSAMSRELLGRHHHDWLFGRGNVGSLARKSLAILDGSESIRSEFQASGREVLQAYRPYDACDRYLRIYREISQSR